MPADKEGMSLERKRIRAFILENFMYGANETDLDDAQSFLDSGIFDSTGVLEVISYLEREFGIHVEDADMVPENLDSIDNLCQFLERKGGSDLRPAADAGLHANDATG
jgi:acyl carrier protein